MDEKEIFGQEQPVTGRPPRRVRHGRHHTPLFKAGIPKTPPHVLRKGWWHLHQILSVLLTKKCCYRKPPVRVEHEAPHVRSGAPCFPVSKNNMPPIMVLIGMKGTPPSWQGDPLPGIGSSDVKPPVTKSIIPHGKEEGGLVILHDCHTPPHPGGQSPIKGPLVQWTRPGRPPPL